MVDCIVRDNQASVWRLGRVGCLSGAAVVRNTPVHPNTVGGGSFRAGGIYSAGGGSASRRIVGNTGTNSGKGALSVAATNIMRNCLVAAISHSAAERRVHFYRGRRWWRIAPLCPIAPPPTRWMGAGVFVIHNAAGQVFSLVNCIVYDSRQWSQRQQQFLFSDGCRRVTSNTRIAPAPTVANVSVTMRRIPDPLFIALDRR